MARKARGIVRTTEAPQAQSPFTKPIVANDPTANLMTSYGPPPVFTTGLTYSEIGTSGLRAFSGWVKEEFLTELQGRQGAQKYREMGDTNPIIGAVLMAIIATMRKVEWRVVPVDDSGPAKEAADFVESCMQDMCYDDQTEILTKRGWLPFAELRADDLVAQRGHDDLLEYVRPRRLHSYDYDGELLGNKGDAVDFLVTPTHRMLFAPRRGRKHDAAQKHDLGIHQCRDIFGRAGWMSKRVRWQGTQCFWRAPRWAELLGFFLADGHASNAAVYLIQKERAYVDQLLRDCGLTAHTREVNGSTQWVMNNRPWARELRAEFGATSRVKRVPQWIKDLGPEDLRAFLRGFAAGDGWTAKSGLIALYTSSKRLADDLQEIALKAGYVGNVSSHEQKCGFAIGSTQYRVSLWSEAKDYDRPYLKPDRGWYRQQYRGKVYCVSVPSGIVLVRRGGKPLWCGNSHTWEDLVTENVTAIQYGYAFHEIVYKRRLGRHPGTTADGVKLADSDYDDGKIGWRRIPLRGQDTILKWFFSPTGGITGVTQLPWTGIIRDIPMEKGLLFRPTWYQKNNPEGRSVLRNAYLPYYFIKRLQEQEAIMGERLGGVPVIRVPQALIEAAGNGTNAKAQQALDSFKKIAVNLRVDEQMGCVFPSDVWRGPDGQPSSQRQYDLELVVPTGGRGSAMNYENAIQRYQLQIMTSVLADFLSLGHQARGTQNLAVTKIDLFFQATEGYLNANAGVYNRYALPRLFEFNGMDLDLMPKIEPDLAQRVDLDVLSNFVLRLSQAGMPMFPNEELQTFLLDAGGLPDVADPRALQAAGLLSEQLDAEDEKTMQQLERGDTMNDRLAGQPQPLPLAPPKPAEQKAKVGAPQENLQKMILASLARRQMRMAGPRFGINTKKPNGALPRAL